MMKIHDLQLLKHFTDIATRHGVEKAKRCCSSLPLHPCGLLKQQQQQQQQWKTVAIIRGGRVHGFMKGCCTQLNDIREDIYTVLHLTASMSGI